VASYVRKGELEKPSSRAVIFEKRWKVRTDSHMDVEYTPLVNSLKRGTVGGSLDEATRQKVHTVHK
jgi:hypothetical protein